MDIKIITPEDWKIRIISDSYSVLNLLTIDDSKNISVAVSSAIDYNKTTKTTSDRVYYILDGELEINGQNAKKWAIVFIPANTEYSFQGTFNAVLINSPAFQETNETITHL
jgi:hypothetical protein